ncbi:exopolyphosphatase PRUNE1-like [Hibiscus syriacus]|uniref:exopolyphosphatase PRUNE1-like n=1 Tax=Hibiscus syriacus TaxID=106335 RepID=UPI0019246922|nr:exopolyphosphatase PRUNE1-like [Hibiscus syriacus]
MNDSLECSVPSLMRPVLEKSYKVMKKRASLSNIPLPQSAASFFTGHSTRMEIVESCENINRLNLFLKSKRDEVDAGVPGRFLHAVIGQDVPDVGSVASAIMYAYYLNETLGNDQFCTVPVINTKRAEFNSHAELKWLLDSSQIDQSSLIFIDEIDLSYYDLFGSLKLVLLNGSKLPSKQEALKESVIEIFNSKKAESVYPWVEKVTVGQECSSCTLIAETFAMTSPPILALQGFSRLLLAGILLDTGNLSSPDSTTKDKYMATLLLNGAGRFGCSGLYQILRYKLYDVSDLRVAEILGKDFKKWTRVGKQENVGSRMVSRVGMSSVGISVEQLLAHGDASTREIKHFQQMEKLRLLVIVSGYYDEQKNFKREILVSTESVEVMKKLLLFFNSNASQLPLKALHQQGLGDEMRAFEIDKVTSRKTIERLLEEFGGTSTNTNHHYVPSRPKQHHQHEWQ